LVSNERRLSRRLEKVFVNQEEEEEEDDDEYVYPSVQMRSHQSGSIPIIVKKHKPKNLVRVVRSSINRNHTISGYPGKPVIMVVDNNEQARRGFVTNDDEDIDENEMPYKEFGHRRFIQVRKSEPHIHYK
jgi:hypothetical protein